MFLAFIESPRFPDNIAYGSGGGPNFKTDIFESHSGIEQRSVIWDKSKSTYNVSQGIRDEDDVATLIAFFRTMRGRATGFRFKDWADYKLTDEQIGTGDGATTVFSITKVYSVGAGLQTYSRRIFKPVDDSSTFSVKVNDIVVSDTTYSVDYTTGKITFTGPGTPPNAATAVPSNATGLPEPGTSA